jgi:hypothetical protein
MMYFSHRWCFRATLIEPVRIIALMCVSIDWFDSKLTEKWPLYEHFLPFFRQIYEHLSQNWDSDSHFEVLNNSIGIKVMRQNSKM